VKKFLFQVGSAATLISFSAVSLSAQYGDTLKIMTYNINYESNKNTQYDGIVSAIKAIDPTIAGLQKLDSCMGTGSDPCFVAKLLGNQTGMSYSFVTGDPTSYGDGFLSKQPPQTVRRLWLKGNATIPRAAIEIGFTAGGEMVKAVVTHLDISGAAVREAEVQEIVSWIDGVAGKTIPTVIMADFNAQPTEDCMKQLTSDGFVFVKTKAGKILDTSSGQGINHILYRPEDRWTLVDAGNPKYAASNRNPVWALLTLKDDVAVKPAPLDRKAAFNRPHSIIENKEIRCMLPSRGLMSMRLLNPSGKEVVTLVGGRMLEAGPHSFAIPANSVTKGVYFLESSLDGKKSFEKIALIR
jgi:endonuclease/exonuclease/phosphatase family metal-dependent hydrolase